MTDQRGSGRDGEPKRQLLPYLGLIIAALAIVYLAVQYRSVSAERSRLAERLQWPHPGTPVPAASVVSLAGDSLKVGRSPSGQLQLLYLFSPGCEHCRASHPVARRMFARLQEAQLDAQGYALSVAPRDSVRAYRRSRPLPVPTAPFPSPKVAELYGATHVPLVLLLDNRGYVLYSRLGALTQSGADSVLSAVREATGSSGNATQSRSAGLSTTPKEVGRR